MTDAPLTWRTSSYSAASNTCVEVARLTDGTVLVRNSNHPDAGTLAVTPAAMTAWIAGCRTGDLDDLAG
jgi:hypothetical protein